MSNNYGMFSEKGNLLVSELVAEALRLPISADDEQFYAVLNKGMDRIESSGHPEVHDSAVREVIIYEIEKATNRELTMYF